MKAIDLLKGKTVNVLTNANVLVQLQIESAKEVRHSVELEPPTRENDWWPPTRDWTTIEVKFTNGFVESYNSINEIELVTPNQQQ